MSFESGRVTFIRFAVEGAAPTTADEQIFLQLEPFAFKETPIGRPDEVEVGFITGQHLLDTQFAYEKNGFGDCLLFAMRMDTHKPPAEVKRAYRLINEQAMAQQNPSGFASRSQKKEAAESADHQLHEDLAAGRFRKSKIIPLMWDLQARQLYCGAASNTVIEHLTRLMREAFSADLTLLSSGTLAHRHLESKGQSRAHDDARPAAYTDPPARAAGDEATAYDATLPTVPWASATFEMKDFLGNEAMIWLWRQCEQAEGVIDVTLAGRSTEIMLTIDKSLEMECAWGATGKQSLRGDGPTRLPEAGDALRGGKWPRKMGLLLAIDDLSCELTLQGDRWVVASAALPAVEDASSEREVIEQRLQWIRQLAAAIDAMLVKFLDSRFGNAWTTQRDTTKEWIRSRHAGR